MRQVNFLHFNDVYKLSLAPQFKTLLDKLKEEHHPIITFGGDFVAPSMMSTFTKGQHMAEILYLMDIDYGCLGNHEFDFGVQRLDELINKKILFDGTKKMNTKWIMSNILDPISKKPICDSLEYEIIIKNGVKIGMFSLVENWTEQAGLTQNDALYLDYEKVGKRLCKILRHEKCELIVVLTHNLLAVDREMSKALPEVDLFIGAHDHIKGGYYDEKFRFLKSGYDFEDVTLIQFTIDTSSKITLKTTTIEVPPELEKNQDVLDIISKYEDKMNKQMEVIIGSTKVDLDCRKITLRGREAAFGNLVADFMKDELKTDTTIIIGGVLSSDRIWKSGELNMGFVISVFPWEGTCVSLEVSGRDMILALENGVSFLPREDGRFIQISGITMEYDITRKRMERVSNVKINGEPVELDQMYSVATTDFISLGGEGFSMFTNAKRIIAVDYGIPQIDLLKKLIEEKSPLNPTIEGRMNSLTDYIVEDI